MNVIDKRREERFPLEIPAHLQIADGQESESIGFVTGGVSSGGAFLYTDRLLALGTKVKVDLVLPIAQMLAKK